MSFNNQNKPALVNQMGTYAPHVEDNENPTFTKSRVNEQPLLESSSFHWRIGIKLQVTMGAFSKYWGGLTGL